MATDPHPAVAADRRRRQYCVAGDANSLAPLLADDLSYVHTTGREDTKQSLLDRIASGDLDYRRMEPGDLYTVREYDSVVCISGFMDIEVLSSGTQKDMHCRFVEEWSGLDGNWQLRYWQSTLMQPT